MKNKEKYRAILDYQYSPEQVRVVENLLGNLQKESRKLFVVIDDDPTGGQTVHDIMVYTSWEKEVILNAFQTVEFMFYIMTNSRSMTQTETAAVHKQIMESLNEASELTGREYEVISRGDSTLRGHYPLEPNVICANANKTIQKELMIPFFLEGNRLTIDDVHYIHEEDGLIPVGDTEFSRDKTFGFVHSDLKEWMEEKTKGEYSAKEVSSISLEMLRNMDFEAIEKILMAEEVKKIIVNATCYMDLKVFAICYFRALLKGVTFVARTAASWPKTIGCFAEIPYLTSADITDGTCSNGGLIIIGSHVHKTTAQLEALRQSDLDLEYIEFNQHYAVDEKMLKNEVDRVSELANGYIKEGRTIVVYTRRERIDYNTGAEGELIITNRIADAVTAIAKNIQVKPRFVVAKGGITSSDIAVKAFCAKDAYILGQVAPGIPVWQLGKQSKYPGMAYVVFPGNVGKKETLYEIVRNLKEKRGE